MRAVGDSSWSSCWAARGRWREGGCVCSVWWIQSLGDGVDVGAKVNSGALMFEQMVTRVMMDVCREMRYPGGGACCVSSRCRPVCVMAVVSAGACVWYRACISGYIEQVDRKNQGWYRACSRGYSCSSVFSGMCCVSESRMYGYVLSESRVYGEQGRVQMIMGCEEVVYQRTRRVESTRDNFDQFTHLSRMAAQ